MDIDKVLMELDAYNLAIRLFGKYNRLFMLSLNEGYYLSYALFRNKNEFNLEVVFTGSKGPHGIMQYKFLRATNVVKLTSNYELIEAGE